MLKLTYKLNLTYENVVKLNEDENRPAKRLLINPEIKGLQAMDRKRYFFNLHSLMVKDYNFMPNNGEKNNN